MNIDFNTQGFKETTCLIKLCTCIKCTYILFILFYIKSHNGTNF